MRADHRAAADAEHFAVAGADHLGRATGRPGGASRARG
jgi:hypothetical protein